MTADYLIGLFSVLYGVVCIWLIYYAPDVPEWIEAAFVWLKEVILGALKEAI